MIYLQFSNSATAFSRLVRVTTWSWASHVDFLIDGERLFGAAPERGVDFHAGGRQRRKELYVVGNVDIMRDTYAAALTQRGRPYDWQGVLGYPFRRSWQEDDAWFCSELVAWAFAAAGYPIVIGHPHRITPRDLLLSPLLTRIG